MSTNFNSTQKGATLLEVLIAILILSFGLLGMGALQTRALKNNQSSFERTQAVMLSYLIIDAIRIDRINVTNYTMGKTCVAISSATGLAPTSKKFWIDALKKNLGSAACGEVSCTNSLCTIKIYWNDERGVGGSSSQVIETKTRI